MEKLSQDEQRIVFSFLGWKDLGIIAQVCKRWHTLSKENPLITSLCITRDIAGWHNLKAEHIDWLAPRVKNVTHFEILTEAERRNLYLNGGTFGVSVSKHFLPKPPKPAEKEDWKVASAREQKHQEEIDVKFTSFAVNLLSVKRADLRGPTASVQDKILEYLAGDKKRNEHLVELGVWRMYKAKTFEYLPCFPNLATLTVSYEGFPRSNVGDDPLPQQIYELPNLTKLEFHHPTTGEINLIKLPKLDTVSLQLAANSKLAPGSYKKLSILTRNVDSLASLGQIQAGELRVQGAFRCEFDSKFNSPYKGQTPGWAGLHDMKSLSLVNLGIDGATTNFVGKIVEESKNIEYLDVSLNYITQINITPAWSNLRTLNLSYNTLSELPAQIGDLKNLQVLNLKLTGLLTLPQSIENLSELRELDISENKFTEFPTVICGFAKLEKLDISECDLINGIPSTAFLNFPVLREIVFMGNTLTSIPEEISQLKNLTYANFSYNKITQIPNSMSDLPKLTYLDVTFNKLIDIPLLLPVCYCVATGELLAGLKQFLSGKWPLDYELYPKIVTQTTKYLPSHIKLSKEYTVSPAQREGAWWFLNPERRDYVGTANDSEIDKNATLGASSLWFSMFTEAVYRAKWSKYNFKRGSSEQNMAWNRPTLRRDRISQTQFCGSAELAGVVVGDVHEEGNNYVISGEYRVGGTAVRNQSWNARGHWQSYPVTVTVKKSTFEPVTIQEGPQVESYYEPK